MERVERQVDIMLDMYTTHCKWRHHHRLETTLTSFPANAVDLITCDQAVWPRWQKLKCEFTFTCIRFVKHYVNYDSYNPITKMHLLTEEKFHSVYTSETSHLNSSETWLPNTICDLAISIPVHVIYDRNHFTYFTIYTFMKLLWPIVNFCQPYQRLS